MISFLLVVFATLFRILPHLPNTAPLGATAVLAGRTLSKRSAIALVLLTMLLSDALLARMHGYAFISSVSFFVYTGFVIQVLMARKLRSVKGGSFYAALLGATLFFLVSNFGVWMEGMLYPKTWTGLVECYALALPFFKFTLLSDVVWTFVLVGIHKTLSEKFATAPQASPAF